MFYHEVYAMGWNTRVDYGPKSEMPRHYWDPKPKSEMPRHYWDPKEESWRAVAWLSGWRDADVHLRSKSKWWNPFTW